MSLATIDWFLIGIYLVISLGIALYYSGKAGKSVTDFFLGGRNLPWYIAGISMVATTFAADTPLAVTELVATKGVSGNWLWWNLMIGGMLTAFFFARLWRRANILTEVEFIHIRYSGPQARFLRGFKSIYLGLFMNVLVMGWVNLALISLLQVFFGLDFMGALLVTGGAMLLVAIYSSLGGLMGVAITDVVQFLIAMTGSIVLAVIVLNSDRVGGIDGLKEHIGQDTGFWNFIPSFEGFTEGQSAGGLLVLTVGAFLAYIAMMWWASWYPGAEPGGGGYVAQRMMSARSEKDSIFATLFFQFAHYCIRPWPWILVGMATLVLYSPEFIPQVDAEMLATIKSMAADGMKPDDIIAALGAKGTIPEVAQAVQYQVNPRLGYVFAMKEFLPTGLKGLLLVAFLAAYMSTISTQLNWGASYIINDLYRPFLRKVNTFSDEAAAEKHYVFTSRIVTLILMLVAICVTFFIDSISGVWAFMMECGAGLGLVLILRWFWWRINAWAEITATITPFVVYGVLKLAFGNEGYGAFPDSYFVTISITTVSWIVVALLTKPDDESKLISFYQRVRPGGAWGDIPTKAGGLSSGVRYGYLFLAWIGAIVMTYSFLFAQGKLLFKEWNEGFLWAGIGAAGFLLMVVTMRLSGMFANAES